MDVSTITNYLDRELKIDAFEDSSHNGLQVANSGSVTKICCGVDASLEFFQEAHARGADMAICHHGISWGESLAKITGLNYQRISKLLRYDMALYACHLPLDAHPTLGNNARICRTLGLKKLKPFGMYNGKLIGFEGTLPKPRRFSTVERMVSERIGTPLHTWDCGKKTVQTVAVVSGGAAGEIAEAGEKGIDVYLSGEQSLAAYNLAREYGVNAIFAGHYATERFGVIAVGDRLKKRFGVEVEFVDMGIAV
ncbi:MAG: Nif3-like dinuclear metal center hexameric protein [Kiritimatiellia bacterium]|jgi:dinuclear metal center YbgI/SA1388 family protein|nr:Nif3-like dinuclear metal center hexameric protein [Kiritimatiellia bacterium]MDP6631819.1 Nif3-like dinuclear metal center hexameric protein [Kiritimatiellia bacterium]MDP6811489.1 Nif3-like dinuclear metal center hexameric protein [Kiritimatiellia bacterium]MDP7023431.1 Nif3-like dinuclear metal center hexameric protein [Kiritimatiellia bacterium]